MIQEKVNQKDVEKSDTEIESYDTIEELSYPQEYDSNRPTVKIVHDLNEKGLKNFKVQAILKDPDITIYLFPESVRNITN